MKTSHYLMILSMTLASAGFTEVQAASASMDETTAEQVLSVLVSDSNKDNLAEIAAVKSFDDLSIAQKEQLLKLVKDAAKALSDRQTQFP